MTNHFDVIVLGTGNAGMGAAGVARAAGLEVAMIESRDVGGTCPLRGCVPKKVLVAAAQVLDQIERAGVHHIEVGPPKIDWASLIAREQGFVEGVPDEFKSSLESRGIALIEGEARFTGANEVSAGKESYTADKIVIATGSVARQLPIPGWEHTITSDDILTEAELPESLVFIGGGVIAMEFSHVFTRAGTKVTILEAMPTLLPRLDPDAVAAVRKETERLGIEILTDVRVSEIKDEGNQLVVFFEKDGEALEQRATVVANGTGRVADVDGLDLDAAGVAHNGGRIDVDKYLASTSNPAVYVAGDALWSTAQLSPVATYEGKVVGENIINGNSAVPDYSSHPSAVYTVPALASVGLGEDEASGRGLEFNTKINEMTSWRSARTYAETVAFAKVLIEKKSDKILGAHLVGHGAEEVIHLFAFAIRYGISAKELADGVYGYPTFSSDLRFLV